MEVAPHMRAGALLMDVCSMKSHLKNAFEFAKQFPIEILSLHPMFGPGSPLEGQNVIGIKIKTGKKSEKVIEFLQDNGFNVTISTIDKHDRKTAVTQALLHFLVMNIHKMSDPRFTTPNFKHVAKAHDEVKKFEELFKPLIFENPFFEETLERFVKILEAR